MTAVTTTTGSQAPELWTIRKVLQWTAGHFEVHGVDSPRLTAELLLAHAIGGTRIQLYSDFERPLSKDELATFRALVKRRAAGEPAQYLTGKKEFYGRPFAVDSRVLIPRPETELLVEGVLAALSPPRPQPTEPHEAHALPAAEGEVATPTEPTAPASEPPPQAPQTKRILDLCAGSGCIAVTLAAERPTWKVVAVDLEAGPCELTKRNAETLGVAERIVVLQGDLFAPLRAAGEEAPFDAIVSNPPYVPAGEIDGLSREVRHEPRRALDGGPQGLDLIARIAAEAGGWLVPGGLLAMEIGDGQGPAVRTLLESAGWTDVRIDKDLARLDRLAFARRAAAR